MIKPLNFRMISHPANWLTIMTMLIIGAIFGHLVLQLFGKNPTTSSAPQFGAAGSGQTPNTTATPS